MSNDIVCKDCNAPFRTRDEYLVHRQYPCGIASTKEPPTNKMQCPECWAKGKTFVCTNEAGLAKHRSVAHMVVPASMTASDRVQWFKKKIGKGKLTEASILAMGYDPDTGAKRQTTGMIVPSSLPKASALIPMPTPVPAPVIEAPTPEPMVIIKFCPKCQTLFDSVTEMRFCKDCGMELLSPKKRKTLVEREHGA
jgi:hypothetical protein